MRPNETRAFCEENREIEDLCAQELTRFIFDRETPAGKIDRMIHQMDHTERYVRECLTRHAMVAGGWIHGCEEHRKWLDENFKNKQWFFEGKDLLWNKHFSEDDDELRRWRRAERWVDRMDYYDSPSGVFLWPPELFCFVCKQDPCYWTKEKENMLEYEREENNKKPVDPNKRRKRIYRQACLALFGPQGRGVRVQLPLCVVKGIRMAHPNKDDDNYQGFQEE